MKKIAVYGAGNKALQVEKLIAENLKEIECSYAIENKQFQKVGTGMKSIANSEKQIEIISLHTCKEYYEKGEITGVVFPTSYHYFDWQEIDALCKGIGIPSEHIYAVPIDVLRKSVLTEEDKGNILTPYQELNQIYHLDIHIIEACNMKCKGCAHFSTLAPEDKPVRAAELKENLLQLKKLIPSINEFAILGGEPLLNPELKDILEVVSQIYPYAAITVVTNGILLTQISSDCIALMKRKNMNFYISMYPLLKRNLEKWLKFLREKGVGYTISDCQKFERRLWKKPIFDGKEMTKLCGHDLLMNGRYISRCPMTAYIHFFNKRFEQQFPDDGKVDIFNQKSGKELREALGKAPGLCDYCRGQDHYMKPWEYVTDEDICAEDWYMDMPVHL